MPIRFESASESISRGPKRWTKYPFPISDDPFSVVLPSIAVRKGLFRSVQLLNASVEKAKFSIFFVAEGWEDNPTLSQKLATMSLLRSDSKESLKGLIALSLGSWLQGLLLGSKLIRASSSEARGKFRTT